MAAVAAGNQISLSSNFSFTGCAVLTCCFSAEVLSSFVTFAAFFLLDFLELFDFEVLSVVEGFGNPAD
jgi:hypothetical protein